MRLSQMKQAQKVGLLANIPTIGWGGPGTGKSEGSDQVCAEEGYTVVDWRLCELESIDMRGTPWRENGRTIWALPEELPTLITSGKDAGKIRVKVRGQEIITTKVVIKFDELAQAKMDVKNVAARLLLEKRIGEWYAPPQVRFLCLSNRMGDAAGTSPMPSHLNNRLWHLNLESSINDWMDNYVEPLANGGKPAPTPDFPIQLRPIKEGEVIPVDDRIVAYLSYNAAALNAHDPRSKEAAFASSRSWKMLSNMLYVLNGNENRMDAPLFAEYCAGFVGKAKGDEVAAFIRTVHSLVSVKQILLDPMGVEVPKEPSICFALTKSLAQQVDRNSIQAGFQYVGRMSGEFSRMFAKKIEAVQPSLMKTKAFITFATTHPEYA